LKEKKMASNVQVILARDVPNLGRIGDVVNVKPGYARNFLLPQQLAMPVSRGNMANLEHHKRMIEKRIGDLRTVSEEIAKRIAEEQVTITAKVGKNGKLFGSVSTRDIAASLIGLGYKIDHRDIKMEGPVKEVGLYTFPVRLEADVKSEIKVIVAADEAESEEETAEEDTVEAATEGDDTETSENAEAAAADADDNAEANGDTPPDVELAEPAATEVPADV
jgi:large subunit ribosomal protein L9